MSEHEMGSIIEYTDDLSDAQAPTSLPASDYPGEITQVEVALSKSSGKPRAAVTFKIAPEDFPADYEDADAFEDGKLVTTYISCADDKASRWRMRRFCESIGAPLGNNLDTNSWIGRKALLAIEPDEYEGVQRERIRKVESL